MLTKTWGSETDAERPKRFQRRDPVQLVLWAIDDDCTLSLGLPSYGRKAGLSESDRKSGVLEGENM